MKELSITRTVRCPKKQIVEKEIYGDTVKQWKTNWPLSVGRCMECSYHGGIKQYRDGKPPKVTCHYDEAPKLAEIKSLEKALEIVKKHGGFPAQIEDVLDKLRGSEQKVKNDE